MSLRRVWIPSPNYSSRGGSGVRLLVLHTAEGARTFESLGNFFQGNVQASSHCGADDTPNTVGEFVKRDNKAWHVAAFNPVAVGLEQCAFASWSRDEWMHHPELLDNTAQWLAEESTHYGIPLTKLNPAEAQGSGRGVCQHRDLGSAGGGHDDCGDGFPIDHVLDLARSHKQNHPTSTPSQQENSLITSAVSHNGTLHVFELKDGEIWYAYQGSAETNWSGGKPGVGIAGMSRFAPAPGVASISASRAADGTLHVFGRKTDGSIVFTYQKPNDTAWAGGEPGKSIAGLQGFAPAP